MSFVDSLENMLFGDPVYDERGRVVKRNFGLMNVAIIVLLLVLGIGLFKGFPNMKPKSGKKKMKGGNSDDFFDVFLNFVDSRWGAVVIGAIVSYIFVKGVT